MINIHCDFMGEGIISMAKAIANHRQEDVTIHAPNVTVEVTHEEGKQVDPHSAKIISNWFGDRKK